MVELMSWQQHYTLAEESRQTHETRISALTSLMSPVKTTSHLCEAVPEVISVCV